MKIDKTLYESGRLELPSHTEVLVRLFDSANMEFLGSVQSFGADIVRFSETPGTAKLSLSGNMVWNLASMEEVRVIQANTLSTPRNPEATQIVQMGREGGRPVFDEGVEGDGQIVTQTDSGLDTNHNAFSESGKILDHYPVGGGNILEELGHGTYMAGIIAGDRTPYDVYNGFDGQSISSQLIFQDACSASGCALPDDYYNDLFQPSYDEGSRIHVNLLGYAGGYDYHSEDVDGFLLDNPRYLIVVPSGSTTGWDAQARSKNGIAACSSGHRDFNNEKEEVWWASPRGPRTGSRLGPDLMAPGLGVESALAGTTDGSTEALGSGCCPGAAAVAGSGALVRDYLTTRDEDSPLYSSDPSGALIKAMLINSGSEMKDTITAHGSDYDPPEPNNPNWYYPNNDQGWGRVWLDDVLYFDGDRRTLKFLDRKSGLNQGEQIFVDFWVKDSSEHLEVTLVWYDPPGSALQNDLNLLLTDPDIRTVKGNVFADDSDPLKLYGRSLPDDPGTSYSHDETNNVEGIIIRRELDNEIHPKRGLYTVNVKAETITVGPQPFALVVTGSLDIEGPDITWRYPFNGHWTNDETPDLQWQASDDYVGGGSGLDGCYDVQISDDPSFDPLGIQVDAHPCGLARNDDETSTWSTPPLSEGVYWWRVRGKDNANNIGPWSQGRQIGIDLTPPNPVVLECNDPSFPCHSGDPQNPWVANNRPLLTWNNPGDPGSPASGVDEYFGCLDKGSCTVGIDAIPIGSTEMYQPLLTDGHHTFMVISRDLAGNEADTWSNTIDIYVDKLPPTVNSFMIEDDAQYTIDLDTDLTMSIDDETGATEFMLTNSLPGWVYVPSVEESMHYPYRNDIDYTFSFSYPGADRMRVFFSKIETEPWYAPKPLAWGGSIWNCIVNRHSCGDWLFVSDESSFAHATAFNGGPFYNRMLEVSGDDIYVRFKTDWYGNNYYGYRLEYYGHYGDTWVGPFTYDSTEDPNYFCDIVGGSNPPGCWALTAGPPGYREVYLKVWDALGHIAEDHDDIVYDPVGPVVELWSPEDDHAQNVESITLKWTAQDQGSGISGNWIIWIDENPSFSSPEEIEWSDNTPGPNGEYEYATTKTQGVYYWKVMGEDYASNWGDFSPHWKFTIDTEQPGQPGKPVGAAAISDPSISWTWSPPSPLPLSGIDQYYVCVDDVTPIIEAFAECGWTATNVYEYSGGIGGQTYYAKVKARNRAGTEGIWSQDSDGIMAIATPPPKVDPPPVVSETLYGPPITDDFDAMYYVHWTEPPLPPGQVIDFYELEERDDIDGIWRRIGVPIFDTYVYLTERATYQDVTYEYRVRAVNPVGGGPWSDPSNAVNVPADTTPPILLEFYIEGDAPETRTRYVTLFPIVVSDIGDPELGITSPSSGVEIQFSNNGFIWSGWEDLVETKEWVLTQGSGRKGVWAQVRDKVGNFDEALGTRTDTIYYRSIKDPIDPRSVIGAPVTTDITVSLSGTSGAELTAEIVGFDSAAGKLVLPDSTHLDLPLGGGEGLGDLGSEEAQFGGMNSVPGDLSSMDGGGGYPDSVNDTMTYQWNLTMNGSSSAPEGGYFIVLTYENHVSSASNFVDLAITSGSITNAAHEEFAADAGGHIQYRFVNLNPYLLNQSQALFNTSRSQLEIEVDEEISLFTGQLHADNVTNNWTSFHWDFGDERNSTAMNVSLSYNSSGTYIVALTVTYEWYNTERIYLAVKVSEG